MDEQNRFEAPATDLNSSGRHKKSRKQTATLIMHAKRMVTFRGQGGVTYLGLLHLTLKHQIIWIASIAFCGFLAIVVPSEIRSPVVFALGFMVGSCLSHQGMLDQTASLWWITDLFTDWKKVEECAQLDTNDPIPFR